jgi:hypothetical protein
MFGALGGREGAVVRKPVDERTGKMRRHRWIACLMVVALAALGATATVAMAKTPKTGKQLRLALPQPGKKALSGVTQYVGLDKAKKVSLALVVHRNGAAVAFLCDGTGTWKWFTGTAKRGKVRLTGPSGAKLTGTFTKSRASVRVSGVADGNATAAAASGPFELRKAATGAGLSRLVLELNGDPLEVGWIATNDSRIVGAGTSGKTPRGDHEHKCARPQRCG